MFDPEAADIPLAGEDDNRMPNTGGGDVQPFSFGVKDFYSTGNYFFKETATPRSKQKPLPSRRERREIVEKVGRGRGKPPLNGEAAMTPEEGRERKKGIQQLVRNKLKLRQMRQLTRSLRKDSPDTVNDSIEGVSEDLLKDNVEDEDIDIGGSSQHVPLDDNNGHKGEDSFTNTSAPTLYRKEKYFNSFLPETVSDQLALMFSLVKQSEPSLSFLALKCCNVKMNSLTFSQSESTFFRKKSEINNFIQEENLKYPHLVKVILKNWARAVASSNLPFFLKYFSFSDSSFLSRKLQVELSHKEILMRLMKGRSVVTRPFFVKLSIELAKEIISKEVSHGDVSLLARTLGSNRKWAKKVLDSVANGEEENLTTRSKRRNSVKESGTLRLLEDFLSRPENSRASHWETVSVSYGKHCPKYLLKKSKKAVLNDFLQENPCIAFKRSVLLREFPGNFVRASDRDRARNACPICANFRRRLIKLQSVGVGRNFVLSTRAVCTENMCPGESVILEDPTTWQLPCVDGVCDECPFVAPD